VNVSLRPKIKKDNMKYIDWQNNPIRFRAMTGYDVCEFNALLPYFQTAHDEYPSRYTLKGKPRRGQRSHVIYSGSPLACHAERLAFILSYMKLNPLQEQHADTFSMTQKQCNEFAHGLDKVLKQGMQLAEAVPASSNQGLQEILSTGDICEQNLLLHDGTEREVPRPVDDELQKDRYSGKKRNIQ
jgi:hypothetical protein